MFFRRLQGFPQSRGKGAHLRVAVTQTRPVTPVPDMARDRRGVEAASADTKPAASPIAAAFAKAEARTPSWMTVIRGTCITCGCPVPSAAFYCPDDQPRLGGAW